MWIEYYVEFEVIQVGMLNGIEKFESERENFRFSLFTDFKLVKKFYNRSVTDRNDRVSRLQACGHGKGWETVSPSLFYSFKIKKKPSDIDS